MQKKRVLLYNWTPIEHYKLGGGVAVYIKNLMQYAAENRNDIEFVFLSSGFYYDSDNKRTYIRKEQDFMSFENYTIVNSPIIAPLAFSISTLNRTLSDKVVINEIDTFIKNHGHFDVVHFHSFEGLTSSVLKLKEKYRNIKFFHSIHDYGILCPDIRLWTKRNENCLYSKYKFQCTNCVNNNSPLIFRLVSEASTRSYEYNVPYYELIWNKIIRKYRKILHKYIPGSNRIYTRYRNFNIYNINAYSDGELCVSQRVAEIVKANGLKSEKLIVDYIGTQAAEKANYKCLNDPYSEYFTILYMGYTKIEKGFFEYLEAIERIPESEAKNINLIFASKIENESIQRRIEALKSRYHKVIVFDGYSHSDFPKIFSQVNLGICPPLWEDNLPQVAIEMVANGIPVLTSKNGGAHELNNHPDFEYFHHQENNILTIMHNRDLLETYWEYAKKLTTMEEHMDNLIKIWTNS